MTATWISTGKANQILDSGFNGQTFRTTLRDAIPWKRTPGGHFRWLRSAVEALAASNEQNRVNGANEVTTP
jgi:hypothetical protein